MLAYVWNQKTTDEECVVWVNLELVESLTACVCVCVTVDICSIENKVLVVLVSGWLGRFSFREKRNLKRGPMIMGVLRLRSESRLSTAVSFFFFFFSFLVHPTRHSLFSCVTLFLLLIKHNGWIVHLADASIVLCHSLFIITNACGNEMLDVYVSILLSVSLRNRFQIFLFLFFCG